MPILMSTLIPAVISALGPALRFSLRLLFAGLLGSALAATSTFALAQTATGAVASDWSAADQAKIGRTIALCLARLRVAPDVAKAKWNSKAPITDAAREAVVIKDFMARATEMHLDTQLAGRFISNQIDASKIVQTALFAQWQQEQHGLFDPVPDLGKDVRPLLDQLTPQMLAALQELVPLREKPGFAGQLARERARIAADYAYPAALDAVLAGLTH